ncbi:MAG: DUF2764 domain-containing protein [Turneriella sp.]|nr:DUF2764 domain-containing protein [Turneriella sp.]
MRYPYLISGLPDITPETVERLPKLLQEWEEELLPRDWQDLSFLLLQNDNKNLLKFLRARDGVSLLDRVSIHAPSLFNWEELENIYIGEYDGKNPVPEYWLQFLEEEKSRKWDIRARENHLLELYYAAGISHRNRLIREIFSFERDVKNILLALHGRRHGIKLQHILVGDYDLADILLSADGAQPGLLREFPFITRWQRCLDEADLISLEKQIDQLILDHIDSVRVHDDLSFDFLIRYFVELLQLYRWLNLTKLSGKNALEELTTTILEKAL